jgi:hypothetical protein
MTRDRFFKIVSNSNQNHKGWHKDVKSWLNHWGIQEEVIMEIINNIRNIITSKLKENRWGHKKLVDKRKLKYYKEMINLYLKKNQLY